MKPVIYQRNAVLPERSRRARPSEELKIAITFRRPSDGLGPTKQQAALSSRTALSFVPDSLQMDRAIDMLTRRGFLLTHRGKLTVSIRGTRALFEEVFGTQLVTRSMPLEQNCSQRHFYAPPDDARWQPDDALMQLIDDAYIQWPHIYMGTSRRRRPRGRILRLDESVPPTAVAPAVAAYHLNVPFDVINHLNVRPVHQAGTTGSGIRIAMIDSGFAHSHPFFTSRKFQSSVVLAHGATNRDTDPNGHGTGESANIFSIAPGATFIGIKVDNDEEPDRGASILEGLQEALLHRPHIISVSLGSDLRDRLTNTQFTTLPNTLIALQTEIQATVAAGTTMVFSAGNGHFSFPGMIPEVISAGGVYVAQDGSMQASDYASAFLSRIYPGRQVPDFCGLVGMLPHADYIALPIPPGCKIDRECAEFDGTGPKDGWGLFSGTSSAAPQLAAICALLLQKNPGLTPSDLKSILRRTARDVTAGVANAASTEDGVALAATAGVDSATGAGLVDAYAAWMQV